jgi:uncharacterized protein
MKQTLAIALILAACAFLTSLVYNAVPFSPEKEADGTLPTIELAGQIVRVSIADSAEERMQGLSGRAGLAPDEGMLFVFEKEGKYSFWMKDMRFSIDIVWISNSGEIVDMHEFVVPESYPTTTFTSREPARYVLELPAGWAKTYNAKIGEYVRL